VRLGLDGLDQVRRRVRHDTLRRRGHKHDPLFRIRRLLRRGHEHHTQNSWNRMIDGLEAGDLNQQVQRAWIAAQELRLLCREPEWVHAERRLLRWFTDIADHEIPELLRLVRGITDAVTRRGNKASAQSGEAGKIRMGRSIANNRG
jgi:transposase